MTWTYPVAVVIIALAVVMYFASVAYAKDYSFDLTEVTTGEELSDHSVAPGKPVVVFVWSAGCPHCRIQMPYVAKLYNELDPEAAGFVSIVADTRPQEAREYIAERSLEFPVLLASEGQMSEEYIKLGWPTTFVFRPDGTLAGICETQGPQYVDDVLDLVEHALQY